MDTIPFYSLLPRFLFKSIVVIGMALLSTSVFTIHAQNLGNSQGHIISFTEKFGVGSDKLYTSTNLKKFSNRLDSLVKSDSIGKVEITGYASLDGPSEVNEELAQERAETMRNWMMNHIPNFYNKHISVFSNGNDWGLLLQLVIDDTEVPARDTAIEIIQSNDPSSSKINDLKNLDGGETWNYLLKNIFPYMRVAVVDLQFFRKQEFQVSNDLAMSPSSSQIINEIIETEPEVIVEETNLIQEFVDCDEYKDQRLAIKTNMLYDAALMPSLEVEYKFNDKWSVGLEANIAWWLYEKRNRRYQIMTFTPEVRYHFKSDKPWQGHYLGLFAGGGKYDLENGRKGYMGEGGYLGISYNYMWSISNTFSLELGLGVGGMFTRYKKYVPIDGLSVYQETKNMWYGGPLRVKFALVWKIWDVKNKGSKR